MDELERARARSLRDHEAAERAYEAKKRARWTALHNLADRHFPHWAQAIAHMSAQGYGQCVPFDRDVVSKYVFFGPLVSVWRCRDGEPTPVKLETFLGDCFVHPDGARWESDDFFTYSDTVTRKLGSPFRVSVSLNYIHVYLR